MNLGYVNRLKLCGMIGQQTIQSYQYFRETMKCSPKEALQIAKNWLAKHGHNPPNSQK